ARVGARVTLGAGARRALALLARRRAACAGSDADARAWLTRALDATPAARGVRSVGLGADIAWCADVDAATAIPQVVGEDAARALVVIEAAPSEDVALPDLEDAR
ncbi:MAG: hypothetical protein KGO05_09000, partial [Chloroflexota bacterium]|nr:hypothetical protein [Chloroflexota bacterium]